MNKEQALTLARNFIYDNRLYGYKLITAPDSITVSGTNEQGSMAESFPYNTKAKQ